MPCSLNAPLASFSSMPSSSSSSFFSSFSSTKLAYHVQEALWRIFYIFVSFSLVALVSWGSLEKLFVYLLAPVDGSGAHNVSFLTSSLAGVLEAYFVVLLHSGFFFTFPLSLYQAWAYIRPSLHATEAFHFSTIFCSTLGLGGLFYSLFFLFLFPSICQYFLDAEKIETVYEFLYFPDLPKYFQILRTFYCILCFSFLCVFSLSLFFASSPLQSFAQSVSLRKLAWIGGGFLALLLSPPDLSIQLFCWGCLLLWFEICYFCICILHAYFSFQFQEDAGSEESEENERGEKPTQKRKERNS